MGEISEAVELRPIGPDDLADVRHIHAAAFRLMGRPQFSDQQVAAFAAHVYSEGYTSALSDAIRSGSLVGAWLEGNLIGTAGWSPADGVGVVARIRWLFVRPLFTQIGVGTRLLAEVERRALQAGFATFAAEVPLNAVDFFTRFGYSVTSHGLRPLPSVEGMAVAFLRKSVRPDGDAGGTGE